MTSHMTIAVIADVHGNLPALEAVVEDIRRRGIDAVVTLEWLAALPATARVLDEVLAFHGTPSDDAAYLLEAVDSGRVRLARATEIEQRLTGAVGQVMLCGHSHIPRIVRLGERLIINPGSVGLPAYTHDQPEPHVMETGSPDARYAVVERTDRGCQAQLVAVPYDHLAVAERARSSGRPDWEFALRTGYAAK